MLIRVVGPDDQPIAGTKIHARVTSWDRTATNSSQRSVTKEHDLVCGHDGAVEVKLPKLVEGIGIIARLDGYASMVAYLSNEQLVEIPKEFTFHFEKGTILGGVIQNEDGQPIEGVKVEARYDENEIGATSANLATFSIWLANGDGAITTDPQGRWCLDNVPPGDDIKIRLLLSHRDYISDSSWGQLQKQQHITTKKLRERTAVIVMQRGAALTGTVTDPDGKPVKGAVVIWGERPWFEPGSQEVHTDEHGRYQLPPVSSGHAKVTVIAEGWMPERRMIQIASLAPLANFTLKPGKKLRIRFVDNAGAPVPRVAVRTALWRGTESLYNVISSDVLNTKIPFRADENGIYEWSWAPDDAVKLGFNKEGFAEAEASISADNTEHVITIYPKLRIAGMLSDASTGSPIEQFTAVPIIHFSADFPFVERGEAKRCAKGNFVFVFERSDIKHGLQLEAPGYATLRIGPYAIGAEVPPLQLRMTPAERFVGRVTNEAGEPVANARVFVGSYSQHLSLYDFNKDDAGSSENCLVKTDIQGAFEIANQWERYSLFVAAADGYAEANRKVGELPGELKLRRWAKISGRLVQCGKPVADWNVNLDLIREKGAGAPRGYYSLHTKTDEDGVFSFERAPPIPCRVKGSIHWSSKGPLSSSRSVPVDPAPGAQVTVSLGDGGAEVKGQLALDPPAAAGFDYHFGINYLVARRPGVASPPPVADKGIDWRLGLSESWMPLEDQANLLRTEHHYYVKPDPDGKFRISGVEPGEYDLAFRLYGATDGCLVHPKAIGVVRVTVNEGQSALDLGTITVPALPSLMVGDIAPDFEFTGHDGSVQKLSELRGRYVFVDFWATWCGPCVAKMPEVESLRQKYAERLNLIVVGANLDQDSQRAKDFLRERKLPWRHAFLGDWSSTDVPKRFGVSSVPTSVLIGPDGRILAHETSLEQIAALLEKVTLPAK